MQVAGGSQSIPWEPRLSHMLDFAEQTLAILRPQYAGLFELWTVRNLYPRPHYTWCARRVGEETACVNAGSPEDLVRLLGEMACQCPRHAHPEHAQSPTDSSATRGALDSLS
jgi:hypothetical protein